MQFTVSSGSCVPPGFYAASFLGCEETEVHPEYGRGVRFKFRITGGEQEGAQASVICGLEKAASPRNRLGRVLGGLAGAPVAPGMTISVEQYIGRNFLISVQQVGSGQGTRIETIVPSPA
jgi:hypothetical protein